MENSAHNQPLSEQYRVLAEEWVEADALARLYEETKSNELSRLKSILGDMPDSRAERIVRATPEWSAWTNKMIDARTAANRAKVRLKVLEMRYFEHQSANATARAEMRL